MAAMSSYYGWIMAVVDCSTSPVRSFVRSDFGGRTAASCDSPTDHRDRRYRGHYTPSFATRIILRLTRELNCTAHSAPLCAHSSTPSPSRAALGIISEWLLGRRRRSLFCLRIGRVCDVRVVHSAGAPQSGPPKKEKGGERGVERNGEARDELLRIGRAIRVLPSCLFFDSSRSPKLDRSSRFLFRGEQLIIRDHELSQVAGSRGSLNSGELGRAREGVGSTVRFVSVDFVPI